ncbi:TetR/AcrR family transcriptional regulator [Streptomyces sp. RKND-216]|uniref:TetR/AcrR family transcriptional regulator n=1 Tax=Streptomyces sp. RKND-216 TaxID=2562581 RepID=UPI00109DC647|nr:TetR/AcrR family transcriptional regulator [Streptomyces sp. RKND-216]THA25286.1 TetR/AcrR family transcriptional regulator [Streptomyces sp. RKND-216]
MGGGRRREVLDAAVEVLATGGLRRLTYQAVDTTAGVPPGSTSNHFRNREALLDGIVAHLEALDREDWERGVGTLPAAPTGTPAPDDPSVPDGPEELATALEGLVRHLVGPGRHRTTARYALTLEAIARPAVGEALRRGHASLLDWGARVLKAMGSPQPEEHSRALAALLEGLMFQQVALPEDGFDPLPSIRTAVRAMLPESAGDAPGGRAGAAPATA